MTETKKAEEELIKTTEYIIQSAKRYKNYLQFKKNKWLRILQPIKWNWIKLAWKDEPKEIQHHLDYLNLQLQKHGQIKEKCCYCGIEIDDYNIAGVRSNNKCYCNNPECTDKAIKEIQKELKGGWWCE